MQKTALPIVIVISLSALNTHADHLEELVVTASHDTRTIDVGDEISVAPDVTQLLKRAPGANVNSNGPLTGIAQYRGQYGARVAVSMDDTHLAPSGPNWMDPPLSYAVGGQLESLQLFRGIAPVSVAQESIGGAIKAEANRGVFTQSEDFTLHGRVIGNTQSASEAYHLSTAVYTSNANHRIKLAGMTENGDDARFPDGHIRPTEYERQRYDLGYGTRIGRHTIQLDYGRNDTGDSGTPALPMDIQTIDGDLYGLDYRFDRDAAMYIKATVYGSDLDHKMTNFLLRQPPPPNDWRRNTASSDNIGFKVSTILTDEQSTSTLGVDGFSAQHDSNIDNPNNPMFFLQNFNHAQRDILGLFLERQQDISDTWRAELGVRYNRVEMNSNQVNGTPAMMMPPAMALRDTFNSANRKQSDNNVDLLAKAWYRASGTSSWYLGVAHKNRSPSYQERYLWLPLEATAGLADGYTYTGTVDLDPEASWKIESGLDYSNGTLTVSPRIFYDQVDNYIQGIPSENAAAIMFVRMMNAQNGSNNPDPLQFSNVDARLYGFDMDWAWQLDGHWSLSGLVNYVRGERDDSSDDNLYRIAPPNTTVRFNYRAASWSAGLEGVFYAKQDKVSEVNNEQETSSYALANVSANWQAAEGLELSAGIDNLLDKHYEDHLGGYNRAYNQDITQGARLPGYGTNVFFRLMYGF